MAIEDTPSISVVIPCRNEFQFIANCLDSIIANDYPKEKTEVLVVDGLSDDGTKEVLEAYSSKFPFIKVLENKKREQQIALNVGIKHAKGEIIMRMDAHSTYKHNYIKECVGALQSYGADNVGGRWIVVPRDDKLVGRAICFAVSVPFGVGNAYYRLTSLKHKGPALNEPTWDINVAYFCCRKELFDKIGLFNENLDRSEDIDFRSRVMEGGYRTLFVPSIECYYYMRTGIKAFLGHMFKNGFWVLNPLNYAPRVSFSVRHVVPLLFILSLVGTGLLSLWSSLFGFVFGAIIASYAVLNLYYSARIALREGDLRYFLVLPFIFMGLHFSYGLGSLFGLLRVGYLKMLGKVRKVASVEKKEETP